MIDITINGSISDKKIVDLLSKNLKKNEWVVNNIKPQKNTIIELINKLINIPPKKVQT